nr:hypothetical protein CFP56_11853 [Quercus suber]
MHVVESWSAAAARMHMLLEIEHKSPAPHVLDWATCSVMWYRAEHFWSRCHVTPSMEARLRNAFDINQVLAQLGRATLNTKSTNRTWTIPQSSVNFLVPDNVQTQYLNNTVRESVTFTSGSEMKRELAANLTLQGKYLAVTGKLAIAAGLNQHAKQDTMYGFITDIYERYRADIDVSDGATYLITPALLNEISTLPTTFNLSDAAAADQLLNFIEKWGSHLITGVVYGQRYTVKVEASNAEETVVANFKADLNVAYNGIASNASVDAGVKASEQYDHFQKSKTESVQILGGDSLQHGNLSSKPLDPAAFAAWSGARASIGQEVPLSLQIVPLYEFLKSHIDQRPDLPARLDALQRAVEFKSEYDTVTLGPRGYDGPALWLSPPTQVQATTEYKVTFSGDPYFKIWFPTKRKVYETGREFLTIAADKKSFTYKGPTARLAGGRGYYHAAVALEYYCGPSVDIKIEALGNNGGISFYYGQCDDTVAGDGMNNPRQKNLGSPTSKGDNWVEWKGVDLRGRLF